MLPEGTWDSNSPIYYFLQSLFPAVASPSLNLSTLFFTKHLLPYKEDEILNRSMEMKTVYSDGHWNQMHSYV